MRIFSDEQVNAWRLPLWADPTFPVTAFILRRADAYGMQRRWWRVFGAGVGWLALVGMLLGSFLAYEMGGLESSFKPGEFVSFVVLYFPVLLIQVTAQLTALSQVGSLGLTPPGTARDQRRATWELAKLTSHGPELITRARWVALLYRMRGLIAVLVVVRLGFSVQVLAEIAVSWTEFTAKLAEFVPGLSPGMGILLLTALLLVQIGLMVMTLILLAALGLLLTTSIRPPWVSGLAQQIVFFALMFACGTGMFAGWNALLGTRADGIYATFSGGRGIFALLIFGDQGWRLTSLDALFAMLERSPASIWLALPVLAVIVVQAAAIRWMLNRAAWSAGLPEQE